MQGFWLGASHFKGSFWGQFDFFFNIEISVKTPITV